MNFDRQNPSPRYQKMLTLYRELHGSGERFMGLTAEETYPGVSILPHLARIKELIAATGAATLLDYGCGKGMQYELRSFEVPGAGVQDSIIDYWDLDEVACYDPCYPPYSKLPEEKFDGVICTDVLEHCPEEDIPWIVDELFGYARRFVFASIACYPAKSRLPNGENAHCTIRPLEWWRDVFAGVARSHPGVAWKLYVEVKASAGPGEERIVGQVVS